MGRQLDDHAALRERTGCGVGYRAALQIELADAGRNAVAGKAERRPTTMLIDRHHLTQNRWLRGKNR